MDFKTGFITLEEHFTSAAAAKFEGSRAVKWPASIESKLSSLSSERINDMDAGGVTKQILSHTPFRTIPTPELCVDINNELHAAVASNPTRFEGFATLPMTEPAAAATELRRTVEELGFRGALVENHTEGLFYDGPQWDAVWEAAQDLDVPIYLHPSFASEEMLRVNYRGNYGEDIAEALGAYVFGWHVETGLHFLRFFAAAVFDRFPRLKIVLGHMGETLPFLLNRQIKATGRWTHLKRLLDEVWRNNVWVTTSGIFDTAPLACVLRTSPLDHVLFSIDYPFSDTQKGKQFVEDIKNEGLLKGEELEAFFHGNAAKLLRIKT